MPVLLRHYCPAVSYELWWLGRASQTEVVRAESDSLGIRFERFFLGRRLHAPGVDAPAAFKAAKCEPSKFDVRRVHGEVFFETGKTLRVQPT